VLLPRLSRAARRRSTIRRGRCASSSAAGGSDLDIYARLIGQWLSDHLGQSFVVENRPGAGGNLATEIVVNAPPDGYTLLMASAAAFTDAALYTNLS
jgi:tripartite-type tricarboxylate transporter receptor subunit TctC